MIINNIMSDTSNNSSKRGFRIDTKGISCIPCRCKKQIYHKETKTTTENNITTTNTIEDRRNMKFGSSRNVSPDVIFKPESALQHGSIEICDTGFGSNRITPEELDERLDKLETSVEEVKKDVDELRLQKIIISL